MLTIGTLRWKGRCSRHPHYDPIDGEAAIKGACLRCYGLLEIYRQHRRLVELMRAFGPVRERPAKLAVEDEEQLDLFGR
jgi:hypothetical protein